MTDFFHLNMPREELLNLSSLGLAHLGDSVFEVMVRSWLCLHGKAKAKDLHRATVAYVAAPAQAARAQRILPLLSEEEQDVFRRGRKRPPTPSPRLPAAENTRPPPHWKPCLAGCTFRDVPSGSTNCLPL